MVQNIDAAAFQKMVIHAAAALNAQKQAINDLNVFPVPDGAEAERRIRGAIARKYAGISGEEPASQVRVTLGQIRTILINVMGEVEVPGTYRLSSFASLFHALYRAGGVTDIGTLRNVEILRGGRRHAV